MEMACDQVRSVPRNFFCINPLTSAIRLQLYKAVRRLSSYPLLLPFIPSTAFSPHARTQVSQ